MVARSPWRRLVSRRPRVFRAPDWVAMLLLRGVVLGLVVVFTVGGLTGGWLFLLTR